MIGVFSSGIWRIPHLTNFLAQPCQKLSPFMPIADDIASIAVWGHRPSVHKPVARALNAGKPVLRLEDGFIRSLDLGVNGAPPLSMVLDNVGIYYDANQPSALEILIRDQDANKALAAEAESAMRIIVAEDLSKYNQAPPFVVEHQVPADIVLVIDQTFGDMSVSYGNAGPADFDNMLDAALRENPMATIWIKIHPDVLQGKKAGYFRELEASQRIQLIADNVSPYSLLRHVSRVYVVTSHFGFEALMAGKPVTCYGQPWYSGWGLTDDRHPQAQELSRRRGRASLLELFSAAYLRYSRYINPANGEPATLFDVLNWMKLQRRHQQQRNGSLWAPGLSLWKYSILKPFLDTGVNRLSFSRPCVETTACVVWGVHGERRWEQEANARHLPIWRMEDGFLRSSGLGSDLLAPLSLVLDKRGIYYDATRPSDLEDMLNKSMLSTTQLSRVEKLMKRLVASKLSKYNLGAEFSVPAESYGKRIILVPGQVETDASIQKGAFSINTNLKLLSIVRERNPDAFIIYKPHPDVLVGNRMGHISPHIVSQYADFQVLDADIIQCIQVADELHTMTSLAGFEALLHGKQVHCYGLPFYAGWGLTHDEYHCERRQRNLRLEEMVFQVLIEYPTYIHPQRWEAITAEQAVDILIGTPRSALVIRKNKWDSLKRNIRKLRMFCKIKLFL
jgi:capsular polysaccharide export protein